MLNKLLFVLIFISTLSFYGFSQVSFSEELLANSTKIFKFPISTPGYSKPFFIDLDNDGDYDLVSGNAQGTLNYFENDGNNCFNELTGISNPFNNVDVGTSRSVPFFTDLDNDNDLDLVLGDFNSRFSYYENDENNNFIEKSGTDNPFDGFFATFDTSAPIFIDVDNDNDLDMVSGGSTGELFTFLRQGSSFSKMSYFDNIFYGIELGSISTPSIVDIDNDNDMDLVCGNLQGNFICVEKLGKNNYTVIPSNENPFEGIDIGSNSGPTFVDIDGDNDMDLISGDFDGNFHFIENIDGVYSLKTGSDNPFNGFYTIRHSSPYFVDLDNDNDLDLVSGSQEGVFYYYENTGKNKFIIKEGEENPFNDIDVGSYSSASFIDIDGDDDLDFVAGAEDGKFHYYKNDGSNKFVIKYTGSTNPFNDFDVGEFSKPVFYDLDNDNDLDLISGEYWGNFNFFRNDGGGSFSEVSGSSNPLNAFVIGRNSSPIFIDIDMDGDKDLISGEVNGNLNFFENTGNNNFSEVPLNESGLDGIETLGNSIPGFYDLNVDGDLDIILGSSDGLFHEYLNSTNIITSNDLNKSFEVQENILTSPNPTKGLIEVSSQKEIKAIKIFDTHGNTIQEKSKVLSKLYKTTLSENNSIYIIQIETEDGVHTQKIVLQ